MHTTQVRKFKNNLLSLFYIKIYIYYQLCSTLQWVKKVKWDFFITSKKYSLKYMKCFLYSSLGSFYTFFILYVELYWHIFSLDFHLFLGFISFQKYLDMFIKYKIIYILKVSFGEYLFLLKSLVNTIFQNVFYCLFCLIFYLPCQGTRTYRFGPCPRERWLSNTNWPFKTFHFFSSILFCRDIRFNVYRENSVSKTIMNYRATRIFVPIKEIESTSLGDDGAHNIIKGKLLKNYVKLRAHNNRLFHKM